MRVLTYNNDASNIVGESFYCEYVMTQGRASVRHWVATHAEYDPNTNQTKVEFDQIGE